jgi:DNA modification methylase
VFVYTAYGIGVQGVKWDGIEGYMGFAAAWLEQAARVLQPGGTLLYFSSPCTIWASRMNVLLQDTLGLKHEQTLTWVYSQGTLLNSNTCPLCAIRHLWDSAQVETRVLRA